VILLIVGKLMNIKYPTVNIDSSIGFARALLRNSGVRLLPVLDGELLAGILTRINIMSVTATRSEFTVRDLMVMPQLTLKPNTDIFKASRELIKVDEWYAPVIDDNYKYLGVYGLENFIAHMIEQKHPGNSKLVRDIMSRNVETVYTDDPIFKVWRKMLKFRYAGFPVITRKGRLVGIVTQIDLLKYGFTRPQFESESAPRRGPKVRDVMSTPPVTVNPNMSVREAAKIMIDRDIGRLIVVENNNMIGIIDREDITRAYLSP